MTSSDAPSHDPVDFSDLEFADLLTPDRVLLLDKIDKRELLDKMIELTVRSGSFGSAESLRLGVFGREELMSTGIGLGIGIPHVRLKTVRHLTVTVAVVRDGVSNYESMDELPVRFVCMIVAREDQHSRHLRLLSRISGTFKNPAALEAALQCKTSAELFTLLTGRPA
ncbi:MAG: PTS sugar transporter subunit IIA [Victivallaceae bacterium]|nr:PTS sugar transporter subunit IIA [Victivallaceae bacterium]